MEEPESPRLGEVGRQDVYYQDTSRGLCEAPWIYAMNELRSVQHSVELLRSRVDGVEALRDVRGLREGQDNLSNRIGRFEAL